MSETNETTTEVTEIPPAIDLARIAGGHVITAVQGKVTPQSKAAILSHLTMIREQGERSRKVYDDAVASFQHLLAEYNEIRDLYDGLCTTAGIMRKADCADLPPFVKPGRKAKAKSEEQATA